MDKRKRKVLKIFEDSSSSDESLKDPYRDDGEYGSDQDYNPSGKQSGSSISSETSLLSRCKRAHSDNRHSRKKVKKSPTHNRRDKTIDRTQPSSSNDETCSDSTSSSGDNSGSGSGTGEDSDGGSSSTVKSVKNDVKTSQSPSKILSDREQAYNSDSSEEIFPLAKRLKDSFHSFLDTSMESSSKIRHKLPFPLQIEINVSESNHDKNQFESAEKSVSRDQTQLKSPGFPCSSPNENIVEESTHEENQSEFVEKSISQDLIQSKPLGMSPNKNLESESGEKSISRAQTTLKSPCCPCSSPNKNIAAESSYEAHESESGQTSGLQVQIRADSPYTSSNNVVAESSCKVPQQKAGPSNSEIEAPEQESIPASIPNVTQNHPENDLPPPENSSPFVDIQSPPLSRDNSIDIINNNQSHNESNLPYLSVAINTRNRISAPVQNSNEDWQATTRPIPEFNFNNESVGVQFPIDENTTVLDVFNCLFPEEIIEFIVESTNAYGQELCKTNRPKTRNSRSHSFKPTDCEEIKKFLGLCLLVGQVNVPQKRKLFTLSDVLYYHPIFVSVMSGRRFEQLLRCLYLAPLNSSGHDKISEFIDAITRNFRICYKPEKELSLDESLLLFRGRLSFRQYIKSKKARYGIKFYELTSASGYVLNLMMYKGKDDSVEKGKKIEKTVLKLMRPYLLKGHELYMDNYYNSVGLSEKLLDFRTHTTGTLRVNRKDNPKEVLKRKLRKGQHVWTRKNRVYVSKWVDKRAVSMITTKIHPKMINITNRHGQSKQKPEEILIYNEFMSGIDRADQMVSYYSSPRKTLRWYKKVFFHLLDLAVWNSFYIYKKYCKNNNNNYGFLCYRDDLIRSLIKVNLEQKPDTLIKHSRHDNRTIEREIEQGSSSALINTGNGGHWPEKIPVPLGSKKKSNYLKCKMCWKKKVRKETGLRCKGCNDHPALCALCFEEWHGQI